MVCSVEKGAILLDFMGDFCAKSVKKVLNFLYDLPWFLLRLDNGNLVSGFLGDSRQLIYSFDLHILFDRYIKTYRHDNTVECHGGNNVKYICNVQRKGRCRNWFILINRYHGL